MSAQVSRARISAATVRSAILRKCAFSFENAFSIGFISGYRREVAQLGARGLDHLLDPRPLVGGQIVHDNDVAFRKRGNEAVFHHSSKRAALIGRS